MVDIDVELLDEKRRPGAQRERHDMEHQHAPHAVRLVLGHEGNEVRRIAPEPLLAQHALGHGKGLVVFLEDRQGGHQAEQRRDVGLARAPHLPAAGHASTVASSSWPSLPSPIARGATRAS